MRMPLSGSKLLAQHFSIHKTQGKKYEGPLYVHSYPSRTKFPHTLIPREGERRSKFQQLLIKNTHILIMRVGLVVSIFICQKEVE